ncbi:hypothetical protein D9615_009280 [Tricholomella constricta]|uniref:DNA endonuclease activator Ctp1 C-terminal domain-containing protein n=1 Tax=Tricholomella constricta TaxID=117010 RepID=A0A8H5GWQ7_9AGAR|nr:hypothetical protein D9615_009280 [Tricholomella constricta]
MEPSSKTFSGSHLRERDKIIEEKHQKELAIRDRKFERLRWANNDTLKQLFEAQTRGNRLATSLGFSDIYEAQVTIDTADGETPYKDCLERVEILQEKLAAAQAENEKSQLLLETWERDQEQLLAEIRATQEREKEFKADASRHKSNSERLAREFKQLQERYDALADVKERAAARYKIDYAKWRKFRDWIFTEEAEHSKDRNEVGITEEEKRSRYMASLMRKKKMMMEIGPNLDGDNSPKPHPRPPPLGGITNLQCDKENLATPQRSSPPASSARSSLLSSTAVTVSSTTLNNTRREDTTPSLRNRLLNSVAHVKAPSSSPNLFNDQSSSNSTRQPLIFHPIVSRRSPQVKQETDSSLERPPKRQHPGVEVTGSSDTEEDSQAIGRFPAVFKARSSPATSPAPMASSQTEADSQSQFFPFLDPTPCPAKPKPTSLGYPCVPTRPAVAQPRRIVSRDAESLQPTKMQRLSDENATPKPKHTLGNAGPSTTKGKGKELQAPLSTPANQSRTMGQKRLEDYSVFKGRGRYAKDASTANESINAQFEIDPSRNGGLDFQYDEVVRTRDDRRQMDAGDCECCRDYYEAVGPLPNRLQAPLWRSPPTTPAKPCARHQQHLSVSGSKSSATRREHRQSEINSHRQAISRHRHHWDRPKTPPGYWNIGFPDTQEAENINEQAREMHRKKREEIATAATREGGRYRRRS